MDDRLMFWGAMVVAGYTANTADTESQEETGETCIVITETKQEHEGQLITSTDFFRRIHIDNNSISKGNRMNI